jgi:hypothetical protein
MSMLSETNSVCDSNDGMDSTVVDYNNLSLEEKEELELEKKELEKGKHRIYRRLSKRLPDGSTGYYTKKIVVYNTKSNPGTRIRDPICGVYSGTDRVGSKMEHQYFKVKMVDYFTNEREGLTLFYDSPEGYERHQFTRVSTDIKNAWHKRRAEFTGVTLPRFDAPKHIVIK